MFPKLASCWLRQMRIPGKQGPLGVHRSLDGRLEANTQSPGWIWKVDPPHGFLETTKSIR